MTIPTWARVALSPRAQAVLDTLTPAQRTRFWQIVSVIKHAPEDGAFYMRNADGSISRQMTGADTHVIYTVRFWPIGRVLLIVLIEISDWQPWYTN
jgi:hypothetical protein